MIWLLKNNELKLAFRISLTQSRASNLKKQTFSTSYRTLFENSFVLIFFGTSFCITGFCYNCRFFRGFAIFISNCSFIWLTNAIRYRCLESYEANKDSKCIWVFMEIWSMIWKVQDWSYLEAVFFHCAKKCPFQSFFGPYFLYIRDEYE